MKIMKAYPAIPFLLLSWLLLFPALGSAALSGWVNNQGCYVGAVTAPIAYVSKGSGSTAERTASRSAAKASF